MGLFVLAAYTALIVCSNKVVKAQSNLLPPGFDVATLSKYNLDRRRYGSKLVVVTEQTQISVIWACKACLLIMYHRLTRTALRNENIAIKLLSAYVALGFIVMEILYFTAWCRPISGYWTIPTTPQCNALINHRITKAVFNLSSDLIMLVIALQMLIRSLLPLKRKLILCGIFSLGIFVIIASMLNSYYSFKNPYRQTWISWYVRESSTAILVANLPFTWTILRECFDVAPFNETSPPAWSYHSARTAQGRRTAAQVHSQTVRSAATARTHPSPAVSKGSQGTQAMSLIDSMSPLKHPVHTPADGVQGFERGKSLSEEAIHLHDFASIPSPSADVGVVDIDLEHGLVEDVHLPVHIRHVQPRITEDGTGGFYINDHAISPPSRAYIAARNNAAREPSLASIDRRPTSPTPSFQSLDSAGVRQQKMGSGGGGTAGTGRSARDRRARARLST
jgi:hypothetical protein